MTYSKNINVAHWSTRTVGPYLKSMRQKVEGWCDMHFGYDNYCSDGMHYFFKNKKDAELFAYKWL